MSKEHNADKTAETGRTASVNRRRFVKSLGVAGGAAALGSLGVHSASASRVLSNDYGSDDIEVTEVQPRQALEVEGANLTGSFGFTQKLRDKIIRNDVTTGPRSLNVEFPSGSQSTSYDVITNNEEANAAEPVLTVELSVQEPTVESARSSVGVVYTLTARGEQGRGLVGGLGATVDQFGDHQLARLFGVSDGEVVQMTEKRVSDSQGQVTTQGLGCGGCKNAVNVICGIFGGAVGGLTCTFLCSPTAPIPPIFVSCEVDCTIILGAITGATCSAALGSVNACRSAGYC